MPAWMPSPGARRRGLARRRHRQPLDQRRGRGQSAEPVLPARRPAPQLHRGPPGQEPAGGPRFAGTPLPHVITTSYLTHEAIAEYLEREANYGYPGPLLLSPGRTIGLRLVPMVRDLRFAWEETPQQLLDEQAQKVRESLQATLIAWARSAGEGGNYTDNLPLQCLHPLGHWYEVPNLLRNGMLARLLEKRPRMQYLLVHNIDTAGRRPGPGLLGWHIAPARP